MLFHQNKEQVETEAELELINAACTLAARKKIGQDKMRAAAIAATTVFEVGQIVTAKVPKPILLPGDLGRIIVRIGGYNQGGCQLSNKHGIITKSFGGGTLNSVLKAQQIAYERIIPALPMRDGEVLNIPMTKTFQTHYKRLQRRQHRKETGNPQRQHVQLPQQHHHQDAALTRTYLC